MSSIVFSLVLLVALSACVYGAPKWDLRSDNWVATDALGRKLPGYEECGPPRSGKHVGMFYYIWHGYHTNSGPFDITRILAENAEDPAWGPEQHFHHWGEPELGYYTSDDEYVIRQHARMLAAADIDTIILDVTNAFTYLHIVEKIGEIYTEMRAAGERTPQICFLAAASSETTVTGIYDGFYGKNRYPELWFRWQGKPLIFCRPCELRPEIREFFTFRESWAWAAAEWFGDGRDKWPWLDHYPQTPGWHEKGVPEQVSVCVAQHPTTNIGRSYHKGHQPKPADQRTDEGLCFAEQWTKALEIDPQFIFITQWNEWVAQRFLSEGKGEGIAGRELAKGETYFVDAYNQEYNRDIEPMKGGHTDNYYYQMIANIRRYKGVRPPEKSSAPKTITIGEDFAAWDDVAPEYRDHTGDTKPRQSTGWGGAGTLTNFTGRNDFVRMKVACDDDNVYFYAETREEITGFKGSNWMLLFIDSDQDSSTGWEGYDYVANLFVCSENATTVKKNTGGWNWETLSRVPYRVSGNKLQLSIPRSLLGQAGKVAFDFKWADNIQNLGDIVECSVSGDSAPDRRFNYRYEAHR